ncbi:cytochrome c oxidase assembly protein [Nocardia sp. NBC_01499]|uniref:cytochrome c oxidase assembly protein n=1 Tax=Nocardia sp. NBC_01499 TaxID=2903597 RepID=UPI0038655D2E
MALVQTPLTLFAALDSWQWDWSTTIVVTVLGVGYLRGNANAARAGTAVSSSRVCSFLGVGLGMWVLATMSFVGVYADTLFWVRALQVVLLLLVVPFGLALGKPVTVLREGGSPARRQRVDAVLASKAARVATHPAATSIAMLATPWLLYLTPWYRGALENESADMLTRLILVVVGFGYFYSRVQTDPVPHRYSQGLSLLITVAETLGDGVLGVVIWLGPAIAADYYSGLGRTWGPSPVTDQTIGAGILWILADVLGLPFLFVLMRAFRADESRSAAHIDDELDAEPPNTDAANPVDAQPVTSALWWENDPQLQERFRRNR